MKKNGSMLVHLTFKSFRPRRFGGQGIAQLNFVRVVNLL